MADTSTDVSILDAAPLVVPPEPPLTEVFAAPHFPEPEPELLREIPLSIPPLMTYHLEEAELHAALGGPPLDMMHIGRAYEPIPLTPAAAVPPPRPTLAELVTATFSGAPSGDAQLRAHITTVRTALSPVIEAIEHAAETLPGIFKTLSAATPAELEREYFQLPEALAFFECLTTALTAIRCKSEPSSDH